MSDNLSQQDNTEVVISKGGPVVYKNVKAYWEQEIRQGLYLPAFSSKFINEKTITSIKNREIICIR